MNKTYLFGAILFWAICYLAPKAGFAQITSDANANIPTEYSSGNQDNIYVFCGQKDFPNGSLTASFSGGAAFLAAWPSNLFQMASTWLLARQLGMDVSFWQVVGVQTVTYFISVLPISVNGYGLREVAYTTLYSALGASLEQASTLALVTRFLTVLSTVPGAFWLSSAVTGAAGLDEKPE